MNYEHLNISVENKNEEDEVLKQVYHCIDKKHGFIYDTGAGAGKTYALKESLVYIIKKYGDTFKDHNQNILCITYTNVAVNEIKERLGNTSLVLVSTIHERMWDIIKRHQEELLILHKDKLVEEIKKASNFINSDTKAEWYRESINNKDEFHLKIEETKKEYNEYYNKGASDFQGKYIKKYFSELNITNVSNFKDTVNKLSLIKNYNDATLKIDQKKNDDIVYDIKNNSDRLGSFQISHDTLLEYAEKLIIKYPLFQVMLVDKFPIILVDEYQDTHRNVISIIDCLKQKSNDLERPICVGFFGDSKQNIYDTGVGSLSDLNNYSSIKNNFNRRSSNKIIEVANKIRKDGIVQKSIYSDFNTKSCCFYNSKLEDESINKIKSDWNILIENKLHCFLLKNESVAEKNSFKNVYNAFKPCYSGARYNQLNSELFSDDDSKLGVIQLMFKKIIGLTFNINNNESLVNKVINLKEGKYNLTNITQLLEKLKSITGTTLIEYMTSFFEVLKSNIEEIKYILGEEITDLDDFKNKIISVLFKNEENPNIDVFLNLSIIELQNWYGYITNEFQNNEIVYQTLHSTKGLQYENVVIELDDNFARDSEYFKRFFVKYKDDDMDPVTKTKFSQAQNLLYVGITRAVNNLAVFYKYQESELNIKNTVEHIFNDNI